MFDARTEFRRGFQAVVPVMLAVSPFGLIVGITAAKTGWGPGLGIASSGIIFAGASQLAAMDLMVQQAAIFTIVLTALVINARFIMYSASLRPHLRHTSFLTRLAMAYLLTDQSYALSILDYPAEPPPATRPQRHWFYIGTAAPLWLVWMATTAAGYYAGTAVPDGWRLEFAVVLVFLALAVSAVTDRPTSIAAVVGGVTAVAAQPLPLQLGLPLGALAGIVAGMVAERR